MASDAALWIVWTGLAVIVLLTVGGIRLLQSVLVGETDDHVHTADEGDVDPSPETDASSPQDSTGETPGESRH